MYSAKALLVLCTIVSAIGLYESATLTFEMEPVNPTLVEELTFSCEANYNTNKLKKLSVLAGSKEILSYQPDQRPRVQWSDDQTKTRFDFKKELSKTRTFLQMTMKKPKCRDQNMYKCIYYQDGQDPMIEELRVNFYVDKGEVEMIDNRQSGCGPIDVTCVGQAGNPPEQMKWLKKRQGDSVYEDIERSYITEEALVFHDNNCSNTRTEHFRYNPSTAETDLMVKCGFGDMTEHMAFHTPVMAPQGFQISAARDGPHKVGEDIQLTCAGLGLSHNTQFRWYKKTKANEMVEVVPITKDNNFQKGDDMCHVRAAEMIAYMPDMNDEIIYCEASENGQASTAEYHIQLDVISNPTDGIVTKKDDEMKPEPEPESHDDMTTSMPTTEEEMEPKTDMKTEAEPEPKPEPDAKKAEPEKKKKPETTTKKAASKPAMQDNGQLQSCLSNIFLISSMLIIAFQFLLEQSS